MINADSLARYLEARILPQWDGEVPARHVDATRLTLQRLVNGLAGLPPAASTTEIGRLFVSCVDELNELDMNDQFICTIEREDICDELYKLGDICGVADQIDSWLGNRDW